MNKKIILTTVSCIVLLIVILFGGLYLKNKNDINNYKTFCYNYMKLNDKISKNEELYSNYMKAIKNYVDVFILYEGHVKIDNTDIKNIEKNNTDYLNSIIELKSLMPPKELLEDYNNLIALYDKDSIRRENINRDFKNNNGKNIEQDYLNNNKEMIQMRDDFQSKLTIITKQKGMDIDNIILELEKESK